MLICNLGKFVSYWIKSEFSIEITALKVGKSAHSEKTGLNACALIVTPGKPAQNQT